MSDSVREWIRDLTCVVGIHIMDSTTDEVVDVHGYVRVVERQCYNCEHTSTVEIPAGRRRWWSL